MAAAQGASCKADGKSVAGGGVANVDNWHVPDSGNKIVEAQVKKEELSLHLLLFLSTYLSSLPLSTRKLISLSLLAPPLPPFVRTYRVSHPSYTTCIALHCTHTIARTHTHTHTHTHSLTGVARPYSRDYSPDAVWRTG